MRGPLVALLASLLLAGPAVQALASSTDDRTFLVSLDDGAWPPSPQLVAQLEALEGRVVEAFDSSRTLGVQAPGFASAAIEGLPGVARVLDDGAIEANLASSRAAAGLPANVDDLGLDGSGVTIALVDSGIDVEHPALASRIKKSLIIGPDGIEEGTTAPSEHGTHIAGVLVGTGAGAPAGHDLRGIAPGADLVALDLSKQFTTSNALRAFEWIYRNHAEHDIKVVSNSWGRQRDPAQYDPDDPIIRAADALVAKGLVVVFSAGNGGDVPGRMTLEATNPNVITVGAASDNGRVEDYSSRGPVRDDGEPASWTKPDLVAPGSRIVSTRAAGHDGAYYLMMNGTSMAAPHVAGAAALLLGARPDLSPGQVKGLLVEGARDVAAPGVDSQSGYGMLDITGSLNVLRDAGPRVEEKREVTRSDGRLSGGAGAGALLQIASIDHRDAFTFEVPVNATEVEAWVNWTGRDPLRATFEGPDGRAVLLRASGNERVVLDDPTPGTWHATVEPSGVDRGTYDAHIVVRWTEVHEGEDIPIVRQTVRSGGFPFMGPGNPFEPSWIGYLPTFEGAPMLLPMLAGAGVSIVFLVGRAVVRRGRD